VDNARIADRLEAFASLLELADANPYTARAYSRAAETIRGAPIPVAGLVRTGRVRELRGIGPGIEARLRELVETGEIAELTELERERKRWRGNPSGRRPLREVSKSWSFSWPTKRTALNRLHPRGLSLERTHAAAMHTAIRIGYYQRSRTDPLSPRSQEIL